MAEIDSELCSEARPTAFNHRTSGRSKRTESTRRQNPVASRPGRRDDRLRDAPSLFSRLLDRVRPKRNLRPSLSKDDRNILSYAARRSGVFKSFQAAVTRPIKIERSPSGSKSG